ncbi:unnamed protein product [Ceutorhynchus assimilis]|uniref:Uncharacterized protein n=1 Tax=Ceutorhynchus assimilis TaxID=467358 RepID=A0A9N9QCI9_9CUCU|nr:unnamed protein product [Ceutorhynchus assimilis]
MKLNSFCRICMNKSSKLTPIFDPIKPPYFSLLIMACASVQIEKDDELPAFICLKCISRLNIAFQFKTDCESSDRKFREYIQKQKLESIQNKALEKVLEDASPTRNQQTQIGLSEIVVEQNGHNIYYQQQEEQFNVIHIEESSTYENGLINVDTDNIKIEEFVDDLVKYPPQDPPISSKKSKKQPKVHECSTCKKVFKTKSSLVHHVRIHTGERPYHCHICQKRFMNGGHLHTHMKTHTGEKNHVCAVCNKGFATAQQLTKHTIAIHTSERPYGCTYCPKRFASSSNLNTHLKVHTGEKNYHCEVCGKTFCTRGQLKQHLMVHTGLKSFLCEFCNKKFSQKAHLVRHAKVHKRHENCNPNCNMLKQEHS